MPAAVISTSPGAVGGFGAHFALRQSLSAVNVAVMPHPEAYIGGVNKMFDEAGELTDAFDARPSSPRSWPRSGSGSTGSRRK